MGRKIAPTAKEHVHADGPSTWRVRIRVNGRQTSETFTSRQAANVFIAQCVDPSIGPERAVELRAHTDQASEDYIPTLEEALTRHLEDLTGVDARTPRDYQSMAERTWLPLLGSLPVSALTRSDVAKWVKQEDGKIQPKSIRNAHSLLSSVLETCIQEGRIVTNPARGTRLPRTGEEDAEDARFLTHAEFDRLYAEIPDEYRAMIVTMFGTGLRFGELTALQARDVQLDAAQGATLRVVRAWKDSGSRLGTPKSRASRRTVSLPNEVVDVLRPLVEGRAGDQLVFQTVTGRQVRHNNFFNRIWKPATVRASICLEHRHPECKCVTPKPTTCTVHQERNADGEQVLAAPCGCAGTVSPRPRIHDARHSHASWLIAMGVRLEVIQDRLGHEHYTTTRQIYGHLMPDMRREAGEAAQRAFAATSLHQIG